MLHLNIVPPEIRTGSTFVPPPRQPQPFASDIKPLSHNIHRQLLQTDVHTFLKDIS